MDPAATHVGDPFPVCSHRTRSCVALSHVPPEVSISSGPSVLEDLPPTAMTPCAVMRFPAKRWTCLSRSP